MAENTEQEGPVENSETVETTGSDLNASLDEITARCDQQTKEINKWLLFTKDFKLTIANMLEQEERLRSARADIRTQLPRTPRKPMTPMTPKTPKAFN
ncbi:hypothetical protein N7475_009712 [Penicillium sp. IBT 31633x]|nr:hypothetical protein N7475_009712 [Penicillium sp. IBT 31633x]